MLSLLLLCLLTSHDERNDHTKLSCLLVVDCCFAHSSLAFGNRLNRLDDLLKAIKRSVDKPVVDVDVHDIGLLGRRQHADGLAAVLRRQLIMRSAARFLFRRLNHVELLLAFELEHVQTKAALLF